MVEARAGIESPGVKGSRHKKDLAAARRAQIIAEFGQIVNDVIA
jgi:hypothetical protein